MENFEIRQSSRDEEEEHHFRQVLQHEQAGRRRSGHDPEPIIDDAKGMENEAIVAASCDFVMKNFVIRHSRRDEEIQHEQEGWRRSGHDPESIIDDAKGMENEAIVASLHLIPCRCFVRSAYTIIDAFGHRDFIKNVSEADRLRLQ